MRHFLRILILCTLVLGTSVAWANPADYTVLGVITTTKGKKGVALMKHKSSGKVSAFKEGQEVAVGTLIVNILRKSVTFTFEGKLFELTVGDDRPKEIKPLESRERTLASNLTNVQGIEKVGEVLKVSRDLKDSLSTGEGLNKILMQAATVPHVENGKLIGFKLLEIEEGSIFDVAGLRDEDIVTHINEQPINDAGLAIRALNSLKGASSVSFSYLRDSKPMSLTIQVQ